MTKPDDCDPYGTPPMFDVPAGTEGTKRQRTATPKTVAHGTCPICGQWVALGSAGGHLFWKHHGRRTYSNTMFSCTSSLIAICDVKPRAQIDHDGNDVTPSCHHAYTMKGEAS